MITKGPKIFLVVFLCSFSSLAYEIVLTRIFSISLSYHFAFMIISTAMLGYGASGTLLSLYPALRNPLRIPLYSILLGAAISLSYLLSNRIPFDPVKLSWDKAQLLHIGLYYLTLAAPFFFTGLIVATAFSFLSEKSGLLYGSDLLGAGAGSVGILAFMAVTAPEKAPFLLSSLVLCASFMISTKRLKAFSLFFIILNLSLLYFNPAFVHLRMSPYKGLEAALSFPGAEHLKTYFSPFARIDTFKSPAVRFAPGLSLKYLAPLPEQTGVAIDGGEINAITATGDRDSLQFLQSLPSALPYETGRKDDVLVLDPRGGLQPLVAAYYGSRNIYNVESNPLLVKVIRHDFDQLSGGIYRQNTWTEIGRSWLMATDKRFDVIDISLTGAIPAGSFGIAEDYRFTVEAFREYLNHLKPEGLLSLNLYLLPPPRTELRLLNTVIAAFEETGTRDIENQIIAVRSWDSICILVKKSPFSPPEIDAVRRFSREKRFDPVHYPGIREEESNRYIRMPSKEYFAAFESILSPHKRADFVTNYLFDIKPVRDDGPFFHHFLKVANIREIYRTMGEKWQYFIEEGYLLYAIFLQVLILSLVLVLLPATTLSRAQKKLKAETGWGTNFILLLYFAFLGIGYMSVEIVLIQKTILPLENPSYAIATVLASLLISSGLGSLLSYRMEPLRRPIVAAAITLLIILYSLLLPLVSSEIAPRSMPFKITVIFLTLMPLGSLMGIPFPAGLKLLGERGSFLIPWAWAINGSLSVLSPILAVMIAMTFGFKVVLLLSASAYAGAFAALSVASLPGRSSGQRPPDPSGQDRLRPSS